MIKRSALPFFMCRRVKKRYGERDAGLEKRIWGRIAAVGLVAVLGGMIWYHTEGRERSCTRQLFAMDTFMTFTAYGKECEEAVDEAVLEIQRLDGLWSVGNAASEVSKINASGRGELSEDTAEVLERGLEIYRDTEGLFDITVCPLMSLWGFSTGEYHVPEAGELEEVLALVDASGVRFDGRTVVLGEGQQMDLGGIAKGYASARVMEIYQAHGIESGMVSLGGNVQVTGNRPDGAPWQVGIQDPDGGPGEVLAVLNVTDRAVITSGGYERYFEEDGKTYIHILDPRTGYPADNDLASVTVVSGDGTLADALSTSLYIMGYEGAVEYWRAHREAFDMVLVTEKGEIRVTEGISRDLSVRTEGEESIIAGCR